MYIASLSAWRGIAAMAVILFHIDVAFYYRDLGSLLPEGTSHFFKQSYIWVDFFFILSGFVLAHVYGHLLCQRPRFSHYQNFFVARFSRIYPLHFVLLSALIPAKILVEAFAPSIVDGSWHTFFDWRALPSELLLTNAMDQHVYLAWNIVSWSIGAEWWTYVLALLIIPAVLLSRLGFILSLAGALFFALVLFYFSRTPPTLDVTFDEGFIRCLLEFSLGVCFYPVFAKRYFAKLLGADTFLFGLILLVLLGLHFGLADPIFVALFALLVLCSSHNRGLVSTFLEQPWCQYLGRISYSIYLVHGVYFYVLWYALPRFQLSAWSAAELVLLKWGCVIVFLISTIATSHFTYQHIEVKARRWIRLRFMDSRQARQ